MKRMYFLFRKTYSDEPEKLFDIVAIISATLWVGSLFFPAVATCSQGIPVWVSGMSILGSGWWGIMSGTFGWCANIIIIIAFIKAVFGKPLRILLVLLACFVASTALLPFNIYSNQSGLEPVCMRGIGFWMWLASFYVVLVNSILFDKEDP